jgi:hypothetical protein
MRDPNDESADRSEPHPLLSFGRGVLVRLRREPAVAGAIAIAISLALFMAGRLAEEHPWGLADAADALNEAGQLVSLNSSEKVAAEDHLERAARAFAVIAFALFGFEVVRAVGGHAVERGRLLVRRVLQWWSRRPLIFIIGSDVRADVLARRIVLRNDCAGASPLVTQLRDHPPAEQPALGPLLVSSRATIDHASLISVDAEHADQIVVTGDDDAATLGRMSAVLALRDRRPAGSARRIVRVELRTPEVLEQVRSADWDRGSGDADGRAQCDVRVWNPNEIAARHVLRSARLDWRHSFAAPGGTTELICIGFGGAGRVLASAILRQAHHVDERPCRITVIDQHAERAAARFRASFPLVDEIAQIEVGQLDAFDPAVRAMVLQRLSDARCNVLVSVSVGDIDQNLAIALGLGRALAGRAAAAGTALPAMPVFVRQSGLADMQGVFRRLRASMPAGTIALHPWGGLDETTSPEDVLESRIDERAERVHAAYLAEYPPRPEDRLDHFSSRRPWRDLWSFYRDDNRNCADFLDARLRAVDLRVVRPGEAADFVAPGQISSEQSLVMSRLEHRRWVVSRVLAGWQRGTRNNAGRMHPSICPWGELSAEEQAKDRVVSDLGRALAPGERVGRVR